MLRTNTPFSGQQNKQNDSIITTSSSQQLLPPMKTYSPEISSVSSNVLEVNGNRQKLGNIRPNMAAKDVIKNSGSKALDESMLLLAQLDQENAQHLSSGQRFGSAQVPVVKRVEKREKPRPPSPQTEKLYSSSQTSVPLRFSMIPPPPLTDLEFWGALVKDYRQILQRLPTLLLWKMRSGVPAPLRGIVWQTISGARDTELESFYDRVSMKQTFNKEIVDDDPLYIFPGVDTFRDPQGDGQQMLKRVLKSFSLYDKKIGYYRGLAYIAGPLLIYMGEKQAFCVLVRLMNNYNLKEIFYPDFSGLNLRVYQYQKLLKQHAPILSKHLDDLQIEPTYTIQWFLSFFATTCPLPMLFRIYDVIFTEGVSITVMRIALSLMSKNERKIIACKEAEDVEQLLVSRGLWDVYHYNADEFVNEFTSLSEIVTQDTLEELELGYNEAQVSKSFTLSKKIALSASRFLIEPNSYSISTYSQSKATEPTQSIALSRRSSGEQSFVFSVNSSKGIGSESMLSTSTSLTSISDDTVITDESSNPFQTQVNGFNQSLPDKIDELLATLSELQKENNELAKQLSLEKEESISISHKNISLQQLNSKLQEELALVKRQLEIESSKSQNFGTQFLEQSHEIENLQKQIKEVHLHIRLSNKEKQRLEREIQEMRKEKKAKEQAYTSNEALSEKFGHANKESARSGLRVFQLGQNEPKKFQNEASSNNPSKKDAITNSSSNNVNQINSSETNSKNAAESKEVLQANENLVVELARAKTAEAMVREEADDLRNQLEMLKKKISTEAKNKSILETSNKTMNTNLKDVPALKPSKNSMTKENNLSQSEVISPNTEVKEIPTSNPKPQKTEYIPRATTFSSSSRFGQLSNRRVESNRFQSSFGNPETTNFKTDTSNYSSPTISRFGLLSNRKVESGRFQSTTTNSEATKISTETTKYPTSSRFGYFSRMETKISQSSEQNIEASKIKSVPSSELAVTNSEVIRDTKNSATASKPKPSTSFAYQQSSVATLEATPDATVRVSTTKAEIKATTPAFGLGGFFSASKSGIRAST
ncbi:Rab GTPase-activating protein 1-like [Erysiphe necator]|nr:Rab GTPase-activating protein 1-like [Erysiphe necator]